MSNYIGFHLTRSSNVESILEKGLLPYFGRLAHSFDEHDRAIHLFKDYETFKQFKCVCLANWQYADNIALLAVTYQGLIIHEDRGCSVVFKRAISADRIAVVTTNIDKWKPTLHFNESNYFAFNVLGQYLAQRAVLKTTAKIA